VIRLIALFALALAASAAPSQAPPPSVEAIAARYFQADTFCEAGTRGSRVEPRENFSRMTFAGCAHRDGRFKYIEHPGPGQVVSWAEGEKFHRYWESNGQYREYALGDGLSLWGYRSAGSPALQSRLFSSGSTPALAGYAPSGTLSSAHYTVFERFRDQRWSERLWVRNEDQAIVKYEEARDGTVLRFVELTSQELDRPLGDAELSYRVPPFAHISLQNNPLAFFAGLFAAAVLAGALFWSRLFARAPSVEEVLRKRRFLWKLQLWVFGGIAAFLAVLAALTLATPDSGHPPFIVVVIVVAVWCGAAFALTACFTLTSYAVQRLVASRLRRA